MKDTNKLKRIIEIHLRALSTETENSRGKLKFI